MKKRKISWLEKNIHFVFITVCLTAITAVSVVFYSCNFDTTKSGTLGDTVGGVAGPIINVVAALLVYLSFRKQTEANEIILDQIELDEKRNKNSIALNEINNDISRSEDYFSDIEFVRPDENVKAKGLYGLKKFLDFFTRNTGDNDAELIRFNNYLSGNSIGQDLLYLMIKCKSIRESIDTLLDDENYKRIAKQRLCLFYTFKLEPALRELFGFVKDDIYRSNQYAERALGQLQDGLVLKKLFQLKSGLDDLKTE